MSQVAEAAAALRQLGAPTIEIGLILGTGLCEVADSLEERLIIPYGDIPHFQTPTAIGHHGRITIGRLNGIVVAALQGRCHLYEGIAPARLAFPVRVLAAIGMQTLVVTNAAGGLRPGLEVGDLLILSDHLNMMFANPLIGPHDASCGPMFPDMSAPYDRELAEKAITASRIHQIPATRGVYAAVSGPTYETRAEMRMYRQLGADAIGMSTVPEVLAAARLGIKVLGISTITNLCNPDMVDQTSGEAVAHAAAGAAPRVARLLRECLTPCNRAATC
ncbi:Purine nucleoside phosphorylase 1 [Caulifigura coniformis]|uniref:Purine nucleoside phosphorylase n=1 Tax=Caulifigura coniformis TaxID=2527983 RepID=A0A517SJE8_9PLAN|nr:purine-nucleoside phosphorylase [Caulifigura coniformis]QDT56237.1 Purine nucleoside phosphorylase 1 [Caulifigura coniformis]